MPQVSFDEIKDLIKQGFGYLTRDGKKWVIDADGLLVLAGKHGLKSIRTELLHYEVGEKTTRAIVKATAIFEGGEMYQGMCELTDRDVQHPKFFLRACETRAVARALRFAFAMPLSFRVEDMKPTKPDRRVVEEVEREEEKKIVEAEEVVEVEW